MPETLCIEDLLKEFRELDNHDAELVQKTFAARLDLLVDASSLDEVMRALNYLLKKEEI